MTPPKTHLQRECPNSPGSCPGCAPLFWALHERVDRTAQAARAAYYGASGGRAVAGEWGALSEDERLAWKAVAAAVADLGRGD
jgi:hypothetical protein